MGTRKNYNAEVTKVARPIDLSFLVENRNHLLWCASFRLLMKSSTMTIQIRATEQYFPVVLFITLYKLVPCFESVDEIQKCDHSNESCGALPPCGALYKAVQGGSKE